MFETSVAKLIPDFSKRSKSACTKEDKSISVAIPKSAYKLFEKPIDTDVSGMASMPEPIIVPATTSEAPNVLEFLSEENIVMYSAYWCPHCHDQKQLFGKEAVKELKVVECAKDGKDNEYELCQTKGISGFPSWEINGEIISGTRDLNELVTKTNYQGDLNF